MRAAILFVFLLSAAIGAQPKDSIFTEISERSGMRFVHEASVSGTYFFPEVMGSGCAFLDFDNDGRLDIYLINGSRSKSGSDKLYKQQSDGSFADVTAISKINPSGYGMGIAVGDIENDGDVDLYLSNYGPDHLYRNNADGTFSNVSMSAGISNPGWSTSAVFLDYNRDGFLDVYVANYVKVDTNVVCTDRAGRRDYCGPEAYSGEADVLYRNNGNGTFTDVSKASGIARFPLKGLGVVAADFNRDGFADIYVANDREPNHLWINQRDGTFQDQALVLGAAVNVLGQPEASMGVTAGDIENDGDLDLFMTHLRDETNTLYTHHGDLGFQDDTAASGLGGPSLPYTGFGTGFIDFDHDSDLDLAVANGRVTRGALLIRSQQRQFWDDYAEPNLLFDNSGTGKFRNISDSAGSFTGSIENSRGLAFGDLDNDGDIDLLLSNCGGRARLYRNDLQQKGHWLIARLIDPKRKRDEVGAVITVETTQPPRKLSRVVGPGYSYLSSSDPRVHFGVGAAIDISSVTVQWLDGTIEKFPPLKSDQIITLHKGTAKSAK